MSPLTATTLSLCLETIERQLEKPIDILVTNCKDIRSALGEIVTELPSGLKEVLWPSAHLEYFQERVSSAIARLAARENHAALKEQITKECSVANQLKAQLDDDSTKNDLEKTLEGLNQKKIQLADEIKRLQEEESKVDIDIAAAQTVLDKDATAKQVLASSLKANLTNIRSLQRDLVTGSEDADRATITAADDVCVKALQAVKEYRQKLNLSESL